MFDDTTSLAHDTIVQELKYVVDEEERKKVKKEK